MEIAAHRGVSSLAPENTLVAFKQAIQAGCKWVELDVQLSMDKVPVVFHDKLFIQKNISKISIFWGHEFQKLCFY